MKQGMDLCSHYIAAFTVALLVSGCGTMVSAVAEGDVVVAEKLSVKVDRPWNQFAGRMAEVPTWTHEGIAVDALQFYVGIKDGQELPHSSAQGSAPLIFKARMQPSEVVALFQARLTRDGSSFQLDKLEPAPFLNTQGFRFEYSLNRKSDDVQMKGEAFGAIRDGQLYVMHFSAPRLVFFPRYKSNFETLVKTAAVRG